MALLGTLTVQNTTNKTLRIYQGPKHKNFRGFVGPKSVAGFSVNDSHGNTYFRAKPTDAGASIDLVIPSSPVRTRLIWTI